MRQVKTVYLEEIYLKSKYIGKVIDLLASSNRTIANELENLKKKNASLEKNFKYRISTRKDTQILRKFNYENNYFKTF